MLQPEIIFRALGDATRLRCTVLLQAQGELCVCELTYALHLSQPKISRHLATLKAAGVVRDRRVGVWIFYQIDPALPAWCQQLLQHSYLGLVTQAPYQQDAARLQQMPNRPNTSGLCMS